MNSVLSYAFKMYSINRSLTIYTGLTGTWGGLKASYNFWKVMEKEDSHPLGCLFTPLSFGIGAITGPVLFPLHVSFKTYDLVTSRLSTNKNYPLK